MYLNLAQNITIGLNISFGQIQVKKVCTGIKATYFSICLLVAENVTIRHG